MGRRPSGKREKLVASAIDCFHQRGIAATSLADVAKSADVPLGNVFYYFKSKDELTHAVADEWCARLSGYLADIAQNPDPWARLVAFIDGASAARLGYTEKGCPLAGLSRDIRQGQAQGDDARRIHDIQVRWLCSQFQEAGLSETDAESRGKWVMIGLQGSYILAHATAEEEYILVAVQNLKDWIAAERSGRQQSGGPPL